LSLTKVNSNVKSKAKILFLRTGNSCRSQMAEGYAKFLGANSKRWPLDVLEKVQSSKEEIIAEFRHVRDDVKRHVTELFNNLELSLAP